MFYVDNVLPGYFEMEAVINGGKPIAGLKSNAYLIFDYQSPTDFKFAGINVANDKLEIGQRTASGWEIETQGNMRLKPGNSYNLLVVFRQCHGQRLALQGAVVIAVGTAVSGISEQLPVREQRSQVVDEVRLQGACTGLQRV